jgi:hypothetical protein
MTAVDDGAARHSDKIVVEEENTTEHAEFEVNLVLRHELGAHSVGPELPVSHEEPGQV